jgi:hypothetical protein
MDANILSLLSSTPVTLYSLQKASGLSQTALTMALVGLGGKVAIQDGGLVLAPEPVATPKVPAGPRGPTAKVLPRLEACRSDLLRMAGGESGVTAKALLDQAGDRFVYTDILLVAKELLESGAIQESRKGRKATWIRPAGV